MSRLDDRLTQELERAARPAHPAGVFERVDRRRTRRHVLRRVKASALAIVVLAGTAGGFAYLSDAFRDGSRTIGGDPTAFPIVSKANGVIVAAQQDQAGPLQLVSVNPDGSGRTMVETRMTGDPWYPVWSPDGTRLAVTILPFDGPRSLWVMDADGTNPTKIADGDNVSRGSWSPDGTQIAYAMDTTEGSSIRIVNADSSADRAVGDTIQGKDYFSVSFSPDGTQLLFDKGTDSGFGVFLMDLDGSNLHRISSGTNDYNPSWSPDGTQIVFTRQEEGAESDIYVMAADGTNVRQLTNDGPGVTNLNPVYSPDGSRIAYVAGVSGGPGSLIVMEPDGSHPVTVLNDGVIGISWQPLPNTATPAPATADLGLGFPVCDVQALVANHGGDAPTAFLATKMSDVGGCPSLEAGATRVLGLDTNGDGKIEVSYGPLECRPSCSFLGAPDIDGDGIPEIAVATGETGGSIEFELFSTLSGAGIQRLEFDCSGCNSGVFLWGGPGGHMEGVYCLPDGSIGDFVTWTAEQTDDGSRYALAEIVIDVKGQFLTQVDRRDSFVPYELSSLPEGGGSDFCGFPVEPEL